MTDIVAMVEFVNEVSKQWAASLPGHVYVDPVVKPMSARYFLTTIYWDDPSNLHREEIVIPFEGWNQKTNITEQLDVALLQLKRKAGIK